MLAGAKVTPAALIKVKYLFQSAVRLILHSAKFLVLTVSQLFLHVCEVGRILADYVFCTVLENIG